MTPLVEGVHYERVEIQDRRFVEIGGEIWGYCAELGNGRAVVLRRTHPDISFDDLLEEGERLRKVSQVVSRKQFDKRKGISDNC